MSREPWPLHGILPSRHWCIPARQMAGATVTPTGKKCGLAYEWVLDILPDWPRLKIDVLGFAP